MKFRIKESIGIDSQYATCVSYYLQCFDFCLFVYQPSLENFNCKTIFYLINRSRSIHRTITFSLHHGEVDLIL